VRVRSHPERFFEAFSSLAERVSGAAVLLKELLVQPERAEAVLAQMSALGHEAVEIRHHVLAEGAAVPVTPLPREDVHEVVSALADMVGMLADGAGRTQSLHLGTSREPAARLADVVVRAAQCIQASVARLRDRNYIDARCDEMEPLAHEGQDIYDHAVEALFAGAPDPVEVIRWKEVYDVLEQAVEQCRHLDQALARIAMENR
jgi:uncharacterized protein Yka (UPF0111/DUF47 family)